MWIFTITCITALFKNLIFQTTSICISLYLASDSAQCYHKAVWALQDSASMPFAQTKSQIDENPSVSLGCTTNFKHILFAWEY